MSVCLTEKLSLGYIILFNREVPEVSILLVEIPDIHGVVVSYELVPGSWLHVVYLRLKVMGLVGFIHLDYAENHRE